MAEQPKEDFNRRINELLGMIAQGKPLAELESTLSEIKTFTEQFPEEKTALDYVVREALGDWIVKKDGGTKLYLSHLIEKQMLDKNGNLSGYLHIARQDNAEIDAVLSKYGVDETDVKLGHMKSRYFGPILHDVETAVLAQSAEYQLRPVFDGEGKTEIHVEVPKAKLENQEGKIFAEVDLELPSGNLADIRGVLKCVAENGTAEAWADNYAKRVLALDGIVSQLEKISEGNRPAGTLKVYHMNLMGVTYNALRHIVEDSHEDREKELLKNNVHEVIEAFDGLVVNYAKKLGKENDVSKSLDDLRKLRQAKAEKWAQPVTDEQTKLYETAESAASLIEGDLTARGKIYVKSVIDYARFSKSYSEVLEENENTFAQAIEELDSIAARNKMDVETRKAAVYYGMGKAWGYKGS